MTQPIITKTTVSQMISLLDWCYKLGVEASYRHYEDEGLVREFLEHTGEPGVFGFLTENPVYVSWQEWTLRLMSKARQACWNGSMRRYFDRMGLFGSNYLSVFLPLTQKFYNKGVTDYAKSPGSADIEAFGLRKKVWWTPGGIKNVDNGIWVSELRMLSYDLERRDKLVWENQTSTMARKIALKPGQYEMFRKCVVLIMMKD